MALKSESLEYLDMLNLTRKTDYALVALAHLAQWRASDQKPVSARQIADQYALPIQVLVKVLKDLHRAGIVGSTRGAHGGYYLSRLPEAITVCQVADALEGRVRLTPCCEDDARNDEACVACRTQPVCPISHKVRLLNDSIRSLLSRVRLSDLLDTSTDRNEWVPSQVADSKRNGSVATMLRGRVSSTTAGATVAVVDR